MQPHSVMVKRPTVDDFMVPHMFAGPKSVGKFHQMIVMFTLPNLLVKPPLIRNYFDGAISYSAASKEATCGIITHPSMGIQAHASPKASVCHSSNFTMAHMLKRVDHVLTCFTASWFGTSICFSIQLD